MNPAGMTREQLGQLIQDAEQKAQDEQNIYQEAKQTAEDERKFRQEADQKYQDNLRIIQDAEQKENTRRLSWREALSLWHTVHANPWIRFQHEVIQASAFTKPTGRRHPEYLRHWSDFHHLHKLAFKQVSNELDQPEAKAFESRDYYQTDSRLFMERCTQWNRAELVAYEEARIENLVIKAWDQMGNDMIRFKMPSDHPLDNISNRRSHLSEDSEATIRPIRTTPPVKNPYDKVCYTTTPDQAASRDLFVIQYKAADKLPLDVVKNGLHDMKLEKIIQRIKFAPDQGRRQDEIAEEAIAAVLTQIFDFMVDKGLSYGYAKGGNAFIFLFTHPDNPKTLHYEKVIIEPAPITSTDPEETLRLTAVGLIAAFVQMALGSQPWSNTLRSKALKELPIWRVNESKTLENPTPTPNRSRNESGKSVVSYDSPAFKKPNSTTFLHYSPAATWVKAKARQVQAGCQKDDSVLSRNDNSSRGQGQSHLEIAKPGFIQSVSKPGWDTTTEAKGNKGSSNYQYQETAAADILQRCGGLQADTTRPDRPYCTQACLLGLIRGHVLDKKCPNIQAHRKSARDYGRNTRYMSRRLRNKRHALDQPTLARLIEEQLQRPERDDDGGIKSLDRAGWAGALFRLELLSHGYTFVGKGTVKPLIPVLHTEAKMYKRMDNIQGKAIPVYLGNIDLKSPFHLTTQVAIVHLMLLSWAGEEGWQCGIKSERLWLETVRTNHEVAALGVQQGDLRRQNVLWNFELDRAILIDFEYAHIKEEQNVIDASIAGEAEAKKELEVLDQINRNRASQAVVKRIKPPM